MKKSKTWMDAKRFYGGVHPVPGSFGVNAMATIAAYMLNTPYPWDTTVLAYTAGRQILLVLYVDNKGRREMTKYYPPRGQRFVLPGAFDTGKGPSVVMTRAQIANLPDLTEDLRPRKKN